MSIILEIKELTKHFGGLYVAKNINLQIKKGEISAIIGPNGAGKTSLFNLISGYVKRDGGKVIFNGIDLTDKTPEFIVKSGIVRAFQVANLFPDETVYENILLASVSNFKRNWNFISNRFSYQDIKEHTEFILKKLNLYEKREILASELSHGDQKILDIATSLAMSPKVLLLDEPTAGMSPEERRSMMNIVRNIHNEFKLTTIFIEHDMDIVFGIAEIIRVMVRGEIIAEGNPDMIKRDEKVIESYLGAEVF